MSRLFTPLTLRKVTLPNRIALSPMCQYQAGEDGRATAWHLAHLGARAIGGAGMVTVEATAVSPEGRLSPGDLGLWAADQAAALAPIAAFVQAQGAVPAVQLAHAWRKAMRNIPWQGASSQIPSDLPLLAPSPLPFHADGPVPRAMTPEDIARITDDFAAAAQRAARAGFQALNLHFAHGYLIHQFLSPLTNQRTDGYGGPVENRARLALEVFRATRAAFPADLPIVIRLSCDDLKPGGFTTAEAGLVARWLVAEGADLIDCSTCGLVPDEDHRPAPLYQLHYAQTLHAAAQVPTGAVGVIWTPAQAETCLATPGVALVSLGRALLDDPHWPRHAARALGQAPDWPLPYRRAIGRLDGFRAASFCPATENEIPA